MKKYKVLQPFIDYENQYYYTGSTFCPDYDNITTFQQDFINHLEECMFIEEILEQPKTVWNLKEGDKWYFINYDSEHCYVCETNNLLCIDSFREVGNVFLTMEEAEKELARCKAKQILLRDTKGFKPNWANPDEWKFEVSCNGITYDLLVSRQTIQNFGGIVFATRKDAEKSIKAHKKEWLCYLNIED